MSKLTIAMVAVAAMGCAVAARANGPSGDACAAKLTADGKAIYTATVAAKPTTETLRPTVEKEGTESSSWAARLPRQRARQRRRCRHVSRRSFSKRHRGGQRMPALPLAPDGIAGGGVQPELRAGWFQNPAFGLCEDRFKTMSAGQA